MQWQRFVLASDFGQCLVRIWLGHRLNLGQIESLQCVFEKHFGNCGIDFQAEIILVKMETNSTFSYQCMIAIDQEHKFFVQNGLHINPVKAVRISIKQMGAAVKDIVKERELIYSQSISSVPPLTEERWQEFLNGLNKYGKS